MGTSPVISLKFAAPSLNTSADDCRKLRVETKGGLRFYVSLYPSYSWMHASGTMSYYKIDDSMHDWINRNLND
jgi:Na+/melibiose symporter-like transporter